MSVSLSTLARSAFEQGLGSLGAILAKAEAHASERKIDEAAFLQARLFPDMLPFAFQVRTACDTAKGCVSRLAGQEAPRFADDETTIAALRERIDRTVAIVRDADTAAIDASAEREIVIGTGQNQLRFRGEDYLQTFVLPNFYFHVTTAFGLLRHNGVSIGKRDYLGAVRKL